VLAYQATYLKAHYPAEFYVAVLDNHQGMYPRSAHVEEAKRLGIRFLGPDVQASGGTYELVESGCGVFGDGAPEEIRKDGGPGRPAPGSRGTIRVPLSQVRGLTATRSRRS
jgi:DNA polymerase III alpha subunit